VLGERSNCWINSVYDISVKFENSDVRSVILNKPAPLDRSSSFSIRASFLQNKLSFAYLSIACNSPLSF
jgi:hypothetical protein